MMGFSNCCLFFFLIRTIASGQKFWRDSKVLTPAKFNSTCAKTMILELASIIDVSGKNGADGVNGEVGAQGIKGAHGANGQDGSGAFFRSRDRTNGKRGKSGSHGGNGYPTFNGFNKTYSWIHSYGVYEATSKILSIWIMECMRK